MDPTQPSPIINSPALSATISPGIPRRLTTGSVSGSGIGNGTPTPHARNPSVSAAGVPKRRPRRVDERDRKRAVRACDECRRQKEKCEGGVPCQRCARLNRPCGFTGHPARDDHEGVRVARDPGEIIQRIRWMERLLAHYTGRTNLDAAALKGLVEAADRERSGTGRERRDKKEEEEEGSEEGEYLGVDAESFTMQPLESNIAHYSGEFSHWNFSMRIKQWIENCTSSTHGQKPPDPLTFKEYYRAEELQSPSNTLMSLSSLPPRYITNYLVDAFFKHAESNYFFVDRLWLLDKINLAYENPAVFTHRDVGTVGMILIILAIGTQYAYLDNDVEGPPRLAPVGHPSEGSPYEEDAVGVMFYQRACMLVPDIITIASLESVQACLLIGLYTLPLDASGLSYIYLNLALKLAIQNGMHRSYNTDAWPPIIRETRNRVFWTAHAIERRVGIFHGRPLSIAPSEVDATLPSLDGSIWPNGLPANTAHMLATLQLNKTLTKVSREIQLLKTGIKQEAAEVFSRLLETKKELCKWWDILPTDKFAKDFSGAIPFTRPDAHLRLEHCLLRMYIGRPFVFPRGLGRNNSTTTTTNGPPADGSPATSPATATPTSSSSHGPASAPSQKQHPRVQLVSDCIEAALQVIDTCKALLHTIGLARASYTEFSACRTALLVIVTQCLQKRTDRLRQALREGMGMIKSMAAWGESARSEVSLLEVFERAVDRLDAAGGENTEETTGYERFKKWQMLWKQPSDGASTVGPGSTFRSRIDEDTASITPSTSTAHFGPLPNLPPGLSDPLSVPLAAGVAPGGVTGGVTGGGPLLNPLDFWRGASIRQETAGTGAVGRVPSTFFGTDETFASFQQTLDEYEVSMAGTGDGGDGGSRGGGMWMGM